MRKLSIALIILTTLALVSFRLIQANDKAQAPQENAPPTEQRQSESPKEQRPLAASHEQEFNLQTPLDQAISFRSQLLAESKLRQTLGGRSLLIMMTESETHFISKLIETSLIAGNVEEAICIYDTIYTGPPVSIISRIWSPGIAAYIVSRYTDDEALKLFNSANCSDQNLTSFVSKYLLLKHKTDPSKQIQFALKIRPTIFDSLTSRLIPNWIKQNDDKGAEALTFLNEVPEALNLDKSLKEIAEANFDNPKLIRELTESIENKRIRREIMERVATNYAIDGKWEQGASWIARAHILNLEESQLKEYLTGWMKEDREASLRFVVDHDLYEFAPDGFAMQNNSI